MTRLLFREIQYSRDSQRCRYGTEGNIIPSLFSKAHRVNQSAQDFISDGHRNDVRLPISVEQNRPPPIRLQAYRWMGTIFAEIVVIEIQATDHRGVCESCKFRRTLDTRPKQADALRYPTTRGDF